MPRKNIDFDAMIANGEHKAPEGDSMGMGYPGEKRPDRTPPFGFRAQTANGTAQAIGTGWNQDYNWTCPEVPEKPTWPGGRSNRTGE